jgi:hypothetical protein
MMVGIYGAIPFVGGFGTATPVQEISKKRSETYARHQLINGLDLIESTGSKPIELDFKMHFCAPFTLDPAVSISMIEGAQAAKIPMPLMFNDCPVGRGLLTMFVIEEVGSQMTKWTFGNLAVCSINIRLLEYSNPLAIAGPLNALLGAGANFISGLGAGIASGITSAVGGLPGPFGSAVANGIIGITAAAPATIASAQSAALALTGR